MTSVHVLLLPLLLSFDYKCHLDFPSDPFLLTFHDSALHLLSHHDHLSLLFLLNRCFQRSECFLMFDFHVINLPFACCEQYLSALLSHLLLDNGVFLLVEDFHLL